jgi:hypothetical protein
MRCELIALHVVIRHGGLPSKGQESLNTITDDGREDCLDLSLTEIAYYPTSTRADLAVIGVLRCPAAYSLHQCLIVVLLVAITSAIIIEPENGKLIALYVLSKE